MAMLDPYRLFAVCLAVTILAPPADAGEKPVTPPAPIFEAQVRPRSGLAIKQGLTLPNTPATIDSDYRGELMIALINLGAEPIMVTRGMRIAQLVFQRVEQVELVEVADLPGTERGAGGFGSTGV